MIHNILAFLKGELNERVDFKGDAVGYIDSIKDPPTFYSPLSLFLVNLEEEAQLRQADRYVHINANGQKQPAKPPLRLVMNILFAAKPSSEANYETAIGCLTEVMKFFQANPVLDPVRFPRMNEALTHTGGQQLMVEYHPLTYAQQNEIWSALKSAYLPSVCYRVKMIVYQEEPTVLEGEIETTTLTFRQT